MAESLPSTDFEKRIRGVFRWPQPKSDFVARLENDLRARAAQVQKHPAGRTRGLAWRWALAILLALLLVGILVIGPTNLAAAMQRLLGYIPGLGLVQGSGELRVLAAPVSVKRDGITVTVEQGVADSVRTIVVMKVDGIPPEARPQGEDAAACYQNAELLVAAGEMAMMRGGSGDDARGGESTWRSQMMSAEGEVGAPGSSGGWSSLSSRPRSIG